MLVVKDNVIYFDYYVIDLDGEVVDEGCELFIYLYGGYDDIFLKIEEVL